ncbi:hypothetical protein LTR66_000981 [Elasticomyces elasticus]|nr:hypothetical protein LTR66_000981 [Elasticomyces elasticus]
MDIMTADIQHDMKHQARHVEHSSTNSEQASDLEKHPSHGAGYKLDHIPIEDGHYVVTMKTWAVVVVLALSYGVSFWPVPFISTIQTQIATQLGTPADGIWFTSVYTMGGTIAFMICGANSDLFGRRWFILAGNICLFVGAILGASAKNTKQVIAGMALIGFGGGNCQLAAFALPELLPNKWRHFAVVIADGGIYFTVIVGPVTARYAIRAGRSWEWGLYGTAIMAALSFILLFFFYYPPAHPRGIPFGQAMRELDYVGMISFVGAAALILAGIVYSTILKSSDPIVIGTLVAGFGALIFFICWETFMPLKQPLTPPHLFTKHKGRALTAPFVAGFVVTMFYYGTNIVWPTMVAVFFASPTDDYTYPMKLSIVQGFGITLGATILSFGATPIAKRGFNWKWQLTTAVTIMTVFGGLLALGNPERLGLCIAFAFLSATGYGFAQYLSIAYIQFGADQVELGIAGGLAGVARYAGGAVAVTIYLSILGNVQATKAAILIPEAVIGAGGTATIAAGVAAALPLGAAALMKVPGITLAIAEAGGAAFVQSYVLAVRTVALSSVAFGVVGIVACICSEDIGPKMNSKIEIFLENDVQAEKNKFH